MEIYRISQDDLRISCLICYPHIGEGGGGFLVVVSVHEFQLGVSDQTVQGEYFQFLEDWGGVGIEGRFCDDADGLLLFEEQFVEGGFCGTPIDRGAVGEVGMYKGVVKRRQGTGGQKILRAVDDVE